MITGLILAAGFSRRFGENKLLAEIDGIKMIEKVIKVCKESSLDKIILIYRNEEVKNIGDKYNIESFYNPNAHLGQAESVKLGVEKAENSTGYMFIMGDQPFITSYQLNILIKEFRNNKNFIIVPCYKGRNGSPTIFSSKYKEALLSIQGDVGGRDIIKENFSHVKKVYIDDERLGYDIDKKEDILL